MQTHLEKIADINLHTPSRFLHIQKWPIQKKRMHDKYAHA